MPECRAAADTRVPVGYPGNKLPVYFLLPDLQRRFAFYSDVLNE